MFEVIWTGTELHLRWRMETYVHMEWMIVMMFMLMVTVTFRCFYLHTNPNYPWVCLEFRWTYSLRNSPSNISDVFTQVVGDFHWRPVLHILFFPRIWDHQNRSLYSGIGGSNTRTARPSMRVKLMCPKDSQRRWQWLAGSRKIPETEKVEPQFLMYFRNCNEIFRQLWFVWEVFGQLMFS